MLLLQAKTIIIDCHFFANKEIKSTFLKVLQKVHFFCIFIYVIIFICIIVTISHLYSKQQYGEAATLNIFTGFMVLV